MDTYITWIQKARTMANGCESKLLQGSSPQGHKEEEINKAKRAAKQNTNQPTGVTAHSLILGAPTAISRDTGDSFIQPRKCPGQASATEQNKRVPEEAPPAVCLPCPLVFVLQGCLGGGPLFSACFALALKDSKQILVRCQQ